MSYLATGLHLLLRLLWLWLLGNHGRCHILSCVLRAHRLLIGEPQRQRTLQRTVGCGSEALWLWCWLTWLLMDDLRCDVISTAETDWRPGVLRSPWIFIWDAENTNKHVQLNYCVCTDLLCWLTCGVRHHGVRGFAWAAGWRRRRPTVVEAVENLLQAGGVELGLGTWILGLLWWYEDMWAPI